MPIIVKIHKPIIKKRTTALQIIPVDIHPIATKFNNKHATG